MEFLQRTQGPWLQFKTPSLPPASSSSERPMTALESGSKRSRPRRLPPPPDDQEVPDERAGSTHSGG
jgi:hypothetical protein